MGLRPFYEHGEEKRYKIGQDIANHHRRAKPFVDERHRTIDDFVHSKLVEIMELCLAWLPEDRISVFATLKRLANVKKELKWRETVDQQEGAPTVAPPS